MPGKRNFSSYIRQQETTSVVLSSTLNNRSNKKLRRLPHVFSKVLELPFKSDEDVYVEDRHDCFKFIASHDNEVVVGGGVHVVEMHPGITKVVVRKLDTFVVDDLELDVWRFRLPVYVRPELVTVVYSPGQLVVTVPK